MFVSKSEIHSRQKRADQDFYTCCHINITSGHLGATKTIARIKERFRDCRRCEKFGMDAWVCQVLAIC